MDEPGRQSLLDELEDIEKKISEAKRRLPAHTVRPAQMAPLLDLEDRRDRILEGLKKVDAKKEEL
jgi:hypothetical protein